MFDLIILYFLSRGNGKQAANKGYNYNRFFWRTALFFFIGELIGGMVIFGISIYKKQPLTVESIKAGNGIPWMYTLLLVAFGIGGYLLVRRQIEKLPVAPSGNSEG